MIGEYEFNNVSFFKGGQLNKGGYVSSVNNWKEKNFDVFGSNLPVIKQLKRDMSYLVLSWFLFYLQMVL